MTLHFRDRRGAASFRYRNRAVTAVLVCEQKPYGPGMVFVAAQKLSGSVNISLSEGYNGTPLRGVARGGPGVPVTPRRSIPPALKNPGYAPASLLHRGSRCLFQRE